LAGVKRAFAIHGREPELSYVLIVGVALFQLIAVATHKPAALAMESSIFYALLDLKMIYHSYFP
jgi:hypothetical protein